MRSDYTIEQVNIRPGTKMLSVLRHLNYKPWFAMAEFVDNSLQSFIDHENELRETDGNSPGLKVEIEIEESNGGRIVVRDNAAGILEEDYPRAFKPGEAPTVTNGLCEFGMGMKSAACWFADWWSVRTSAIGEPFERTVTFDMDEIVANDLEELRVETRVARKSTHYTEITLARLNRPPYGRTIGKIRDHLASIYRMFLRDGVLTLRFQNDLLSFDDSPILQVPHYKNKGERIVWRKDIDFDFGNGLSARGFAALRETASVSNAGFALFRRRRLIQGSGDETYRPEAVFGKSNSYTYQRLFGEIELEGFSVSHTKDGFRWDDNEETFLELLEEHLDSEPVPLLRQAEGHRVKAQPEEWAKGAQIASERTAAVIASDVASILAEQVTKQPVSIPPSASLPDAAVSSRRLISVELNGEKWEIFLELSTDPAVGDWLTLSDNRAAEKRAGSDWVRRIEMRLALAHPFTERFVGTTASEIEPIVRIAIAIGLAEVTAREAGVKEAGTIRRNLNELLRFALFKP